MHDKDARILTDTTATSYLAEGLKIGQTYYWMVIPKDHLRYGVCQEGFYKIIINSPPQLSKYSKQSVELGNEFQLQLKATDKNADHVKSLQFSLVTAPEGMVIEPTTGLITWTPTKNQVGKHSIEVTLSDGIDKINITFEIEVTEKTTESKDTKADTLLFLILIIIIIVIILVIMIFMGLKKKKKAKQEPIQPIQSENQEYGIQESVDQEDLYYTPPEEPQIETTIDYTIPESPQMESKFESFKQPEQAPNEEKVEWEE
jgi:hypothetical protein